MVQISKYNRKRVRQIHLSGDVAAMLLLGSVDKGNNDRPVTEADLTRRLERPRPYFSIRQTEPSVVRVASETDGQSHVFMWLDDAMTVRVLKMFDVLTKTDDVGYLDYGRLYDIMNDK